jgi:hypothetical protein
MGNSSGRVSLRRRTSSLDHHLFAAPSRNVETVAQLLFPSGIDDLDPILGFVFDRGLLFE